MHLTIRRYQVDPGSVEEATRRVREGLVPTIKETPGFLAYYVLDSGDGTVASVSVFEDQAGAEESTRRAADWVGQNLATLLPIPPEVVAGEVTVYEAAAAGPVSGVTDTVGGVTDTVGGITGGLLGGGGEQEKEEPRRRER